MNRLLVACFMFGVSVHSLTAEPGPQSGEARIRLAGIFLQGFNVWKIDKPDCDHPPQKPWLHLDCGLIKCAKPTLLGIPLELDYSNWRKSPRMTEVAIPAGLPFAIHFGGALVTASGAPIGGGFYTLTSRSGVFDVKFTPRAGGAYEATIDPGADGGCFLRLSEIKATDSGTHERVPVKSAEAQACDGPPREP
jgi:hypothetical protein